MADWAKTQTAQGIHMRAGDENRTRVLRWASGCFARTMITKYLITRFGRNVCANEFHGASKMLISKICNDERLLISVYYNRRKNVKVRDLRGLLKRGGRVEVRQSGSHLIVRCGTCRSVVPIHSGDIPKGLLRAIDRDLAPCPGKDWLRND